MKLPYLNQECTLTLREGLAIHYSVDSSYKKNVKIAPVFYNHDIAHVLFGLSTAVQHESLVDTRIIFGTNWGFKKYVNDYFKNPDAIKIIMQIFEEIGYVRGTLLSLKSFFKAFRVIIDCIRMSKKWKVNPSDNLLDTSLSDLRKQYNITIIN